MDRATQLHFTIQLTKLWLLLGEVKGPIAHMQHCSTLHKPQHFSSCCLTKLRSQPMNILIVPFNNPVMASKVGPLLLCIIMLLVVSQGSQVRHSHGPTPQPVNSTAPAAQPNIPMRGVTQGSLQPQECEGRCSARCSATQYKKPCLFFCNKCCATCLCVPPGTYGNKQMCPCYNNWKTKRGGPKCP